MNIPASSTEDYISKIPGDRIPAFTKLRDTISQKLPEGYEEMMSYGMVGFVVPKGIYPSGYHCKPNPEVPFISIASQKNFIALYHIALYSKPELHDVFVDEYPKPCKYKINLVKTL